ncbi:Uncharacterised protein [Mycobacterium tuberculosis]|nr:Uncharacterised protein [Mycobacterium tuberculosis]
MHRASTYALARIIVPHLERVCSVYDARVLPAEPIHGQLIAGKIVLRIAKRPRIQHHDPHSGFAELLGQTPARRAGSHNDNIHSFAFVFTLHPFLCSSFASQGSSCFIRT